ncbi:hypothetical protein [Streptomyces sp. NPDC001389]|uniref:hypothetical protein n=1 Tax=Streptomyces sp. NPDC001389 TaxID=3364569 RepID=UPI00367EDBA1
MTATKGGVMAGRPATGQTPVKSFRPPPALWAELERIAVIEGRKTSEVLVEAAHDWVRKKIREHPQEASKPGA